MSLLIITYKIRSCMLMYFPEMGESLWDQEYHSAVDTKHGVEALHKSLKYSYLPKQHSIAITLSSICQGTNWRFFTRKPQDLFVQELTTSNPVYVKVTRNWFKCKQQDISAISTLTSSDSPIIILLLNHQQRPKFNIYFKSVFTVEDLSNIPDKGISPIREYPW